MANFVPPLHPFVQGVAFWLCRDASTTHGLSVHQRPAVRHWVSMISAWSLTDNRTSATSVRVWTGVVP